MIETAMKSPFPGMDPWLESRWSNIHTTLVVAIQEALQPLLPAGLRARAEERVLLEDAGAPHTYRGDVAVIEVGENRSERSGSRAGVTAAAIVIDYPASESVERWVQIVDTTSGNRVVTAIEVLSPSDKAPGRSNASCLRKIADYGRAAVNVVEIDLLREPPRTHLPVRTEDLPVDRRTPYLVGIRRAGEPTRWYAYPLPLRERLPRIPVPLRATDADVVLDLQPLIERAYVAGGHDDIDYGKPPVPPLPPEDTAWAAAVLAARGERSGEESG